MPAPSTVNEFLELVQKSGVVEDKKLDAYLEKLRAAAALPVKPSELAGLMIRDGLITTFQAEQFLLGKWRRFTIGKYKVLERLGQGGMGSVYLCEHKMMRRRVAVKVLPTQKAEDDAALQRFYREARAVAALDHPNIVRAYDIDQDDKLHFLVMEYVDGSSLQDIVKKVGPLDVTRACHYIRQAATGLQHAHETAGLVHRDIKPGNILVDRSGQVKVLDMGLARFFNDEEDNITKKYDENVLGTADYLAPEQALNSHDVDIRADIYSLGATFYFCLTGRTPFNEGTVAQKLIWHQTRQPKPIRSIRPEVPEALVAIIDKMMAKDPSQRYQTPAAVAEALEPWTQTPIDPPPENEMPRLSLAALGPTSLPDVNLGARPSPAVPASPTPQRTWEVAVPPPSSKPTNPPPGPRSAPLPGPGEAPTQPTRKPGAPPSPAPVVRGNRPAASVRPAAPNGSVAAPEPGTEVLTSDEGVNWDQLAETGPTAKADTDPSSEKKQAPQRKPRPVRTPKAEAKRLRLIIGAVVVGVLVLGGGGLAVAYLLGVFGKTPPTSDTSQAGLEKVDLSWKGEGDAHSWEEAFKKVRPGGRILIQDNDVTTPLSLGKGQGGWVTAVPNVTIEPAPNLTAVRWHAPSSTLFGRLINLYNVEGLTLRGLELDGEGKLDELISLGHSCPGVALENMALKGYKKYAIQFADAGGEEGRPITCQDLKIGPALPGQAPPPTAGVLIQVSGKLLNVAAGQHLVFRKCVFEIAPPFKVISTKGPLDRVTLDGNVQRVPGQPEAAISALPPP